MDKRYVHVKKEKVNGEKLLRVVVYEDNQKPANHTFVIFNNS